MTTTPTLPQPFQHLTELCNSLDLLTYINPTNHVACKQAFLQNRTMPAFEYLPVPMHFRDMVGEIAGLDLQGHPASGLYESVRQHTLLLLDLLLHIGTPDFARVALKADTPPSDTEIQAALEVLQGKQPKTPREHIGVEVVQHAMQQILSEFGLLGWKVAIGNTIARCRVIRSTRTIELSQNANYFVGDDQKLIVHEIYGHIFRHANGERQPLPILAFGTPDYLATEEGITAYLEEQWGFREDASGAARHVLASRAALRHGFAGAFDEMRPFCASDEKTFQLVLRAKRGVANHSQPGAYLKDLAYFRGYRIVAQYVKDGGNLFDLYIGKVSVQDLALLEPLAKAGWIVAPSVLPPLPLLNH
jgi:hypothetical protein